jgi:hypothetical protein
VIFLDVIQCSQQKNYPAEHHLAFFARRRRFLVRKVHHKTDLNNYFEHKGLSTRRYTGETEQQKIKVSRALGAVFTLDGGANHMFERNGDPQKPALRLVK